MEFMESKFALLIVDKLLLGILLLVFGLWANRAFEKFKNEQSFLSEMNKQKVSKIGSVWEEFYALEQLAWDHRLCLAKILWNEMKDDEVQGINPEVPRNDDDVIALVDLAMKQPKTFHDVIDERSKVEAQPIKDLAIEKAAEALQLLTLTRFWIGKDLYVKYSEHYTALTEVSRNWASMAKNGKLQSALRKINKTRENIDSTIANLKR